MSRAPRKRTCKAKRCDVRFVPRASFQVACSPPCALQVVRDEVERKRVAAQREQRNAERRERRERREAKRRLMRRSDWMKGAQAAFNAYIRARDAHLPCISCGTRTTQNIALTGGGFDCGHYRSVGANPELRFEELNAHKQCKRCNNQLSGNVVNYRIGLLERIGEKKLAWLEGPHPAKKYTIEELSEIRGLYRYKLAKLKKERG